MPSETPVAALSHGRSIAVLIDALRDAGLLVRASESLPETITDVVDDSRAVSAGSAFVAVQGHAQDGHDWLDDAQARGAVLAVVEHGDRSSLPFLEVRDGRYVLPSALGWGLEMEESFVERYRYPDGPDCADTAEADRVAAEQPGAPPYVKFWRVR